MRETPTICASNYASTTLGPMQLDPGKLFDSLGEPDYHQLQQLVEPSTNLKYTPMSQSSIRRIVKVFIADPNENVPLGNCVLFAGEEKFTDATDTELFFEVPITDLLVAHNLARVKWADKEATKRSGKDVFLDPVKIRDLKMVVVTIAQF